MYCYHEFKLSYLKNLKLFSIKSKRIIWAYSFVKKRRQVLALFINIFLRNRSLSDGKKCKFGKGNLYLTENWLSWNKMCCTSNNHNYYVSHICKRIFKFELQLSSYWQNTTFSRYCPKFNVFTKIIIFQVYLQLFRPTASSL